MNELITYKIRFRALEGNPFRTEPVVYKPRPKPISLELRAAMDEAEEFLSLGSWVRVENLSLIAKKHRVGAESLFDSLRLAESDSGKWLCLPNEYTPLFAPDE